MSHYALTPANRAYFGAADTKLLEYLRLYKRWEAGKKTAKGKVERLLDFQQIEFM